MKQRIGAILIATVMSVFPLHLAGEQEAEAGITELLTIVTTYVRTIHPDGTIQWMNGATTFPSGWTITPDGTSISPSGAVHGPNGAGIQQPNGDVLYPDGRIDHFDGDRWVPIPGHPWPIFTWGEFYEHSTGIITRYWGGSQTGRRRATDPYSGPGLGQSMAPTPPGPTVPTLYGGKMRLYVPQFAPGQLPGGGGAGGAIIK